MFCNIECDDSKRVTVLARHQTADGAFEIGLAEISLHEGRTELSVIIDDEIIILIVAVRHNRGRPSVNPEPPMPQDVVPNPSADADQLEVATDQAIAACGGNAREAVRALIVANEFWNRKSAS